MVLSYDMTPLDNDGYGTWRNQFSYFKLIVLYYLKKKLFASCLLPWGPHISLRPFLCAAHGLLA